MKNLLRGTMVFLALLLVGGCASSNWGWATRGIHPGGTPYTATNGGFTVCFPRGWEFMERTPDEVIGYLTRTNEIDTRLVTIKYTPLADPLPYTQRVLQPGLSSDELAEALIEDLRQGLPPNTLTILERGPASIDGSPGCKVLVRYEVVGMREALKKKIFGPGKPVLMKSFYSTIHDARLFMLMYSAQAGTPYEAGLAGFEETAKSFRFGAVK
jgi:hypothetical protein